MNPTRCWLFILVMATSQAFAQDVDSLSVKSDSVLTASDPVLSDTLLTSADSLSIFNLIDSLLALNGQLGSQLALRVGYNSNVLSAGRTLGIENFGLSPSISYYHKTGLYADVTGYWSKDFDPTYYLTTVTFGYMNEFSKRFSLLANYDRYFYSVADEDSYIPYKNSLSVTPYIEFKPVSFSLNYSLYFGDQTAHRFTPGLTLTWEKEKLWKIFDRVAIMPSFFVLYGNEIITTIDVIFPQTLLELIQFRRKYGRPYMIVQNDETEWGIMNYALSVPLSISYKNWNFMFTYIYNVPKALPGETLTLSESTYLSASLMYIINLKPAKK